MSDEIWIPLDQLLLPAPGGVGRYTAEILKALAGSAPEHQVNLTGLVSSWGPKHNLRNKLDLPGNVGLKRISPSTALTARMWAKGISFRPKATVFSPSPLAPLSQSNKRSNRVIVTFHDAIPWTHPERLTSHGARWHREQGRRAEKFADAVVVPSHSTARSLSQFLNFGDRIHVVEPGLASSLSSLDPSLFESIRLRLGLDSPYILSVGTIEPRKGFEHILESLRYLPKQERPKLVIVGKLGWLNRKAAMQILDSENVIWLNNLSDSELAAVYAGAQVYVMASEAEGFGLPLLEAMYFGVPTIHSRVPALLELSGGNSLVVDLKATDTPGKAIADSIIQSLATHTESRSQIARSRADLFSWENSVRKLWPLLSE